MMNHPGKKWRREFMVKNQNVMVQNQQVVVITSIAREKAAPAAAIVVVARVAEQVLADPKKVDQSIGTMLPNRSNVARKTNRTPD